MPFCAGHLTPLLSGATQTQEEEEQGDRRGSIGTAMFLPALRLGGHRMDTQPPRPSHGAELGKKPSVFPSLLLSPYKTAQPGMSYRRREEKPGENVIAVSS